MNTTTFDMDIICIILIYYGFWVAFYFSIIYSKNIQLWYYKLKKFSTKHPRLSLIRLGYYYSKKIDNHYYASLIVSICKKHLDIKNITPGDVLSDLYSSTKFGPVYYYRNITGFMGRSMLFSLIRKIHIGSGLLIFLNRNYNLKIDLNNYVLDRETYKYIQDSDIFKFISSFINLPDELSILNIIEFVFFMCLILILFRVLLKLWTIPDRRVSIFNANKGSNLLAKLSRGQIFYFRLGVTIHSIVTRLQAYGQLIFGYLILCQLDLTSFIKIDGIFEFIDYILENIIKFWGFKNKKEYYLFDKLKKLYE